MLALVHPTQPTPSSSSSSSRSSSSRLSQRRHSTFSSSSSSTSFSRNSRHSQPLSYPQPTPPPPPPAAPTPTPSSISRPPSIHSSPPFDIHTYPSQELLRLLASLLTQIAATNDAISAPAPLQPDPPSARPPSLTSPSTYHTPIWRSLTTASRTALSTPSSTLTFHARNIPTISLEAYLLRILKYCPATNEVFLSLLVYFDRMSKMSTDATGKAFVIDSYNIHRLVIAGVTVASKFFSDVFYTNSRYAKVGGLPQPELNQLELQFLLLNDFRLVIPKDEMQRYAEQLILFSSSASAIAAPPPPPNLRSPSPARPSRAMGAVDAYGGHLLPDEHSSSSNNNRTPHILPRYGHARTLSESTTTTEPETEPETEVETDGGETDDEPTIRPAHSSASSIREDSDSLYAYRSGSLGVDEEDTGDEGGDEEDEEDGRGLARGMDDDDTDEDPKGDLTPEGRPASDEPMSSP